MYDRYGEEGFKCGEDGMGAMAKASAPKPNEGCEAEDCVLLGRSVQGKAYQHENHPQDRLQGVQRKRRG